MKLPTPFIIAMILMLVVPMLSGCSAGAVISKSASFAVSKYCKVPEGGRKAVRKVVDRAVFPDAIRVTCASDD
jgi:hypothetical protein